jgi:8-oxo-dGTP diphosphatase
MMCVMHPPFAVTVDLVVLTVRDGSLQVLTVRRGGPPYQGEWALPGGFVRVDEDLPAAAARELAEETGVPVGSVHLEQLASYGRPDRDPRMRTVSVAHLVLAPALPDPSAGSDASDARWVPVARARRLAFDHDAILADGVERARSKLEYTPLAAEFCPAEFTIGELRAVYEAVWGAPLDPRNFHRKVTGSAGFLVPTGRWSAGGRGRPAQLYRRGPTTLLTPPMLRAGS